MEIELQKITCQEVLDGKQIDGDDHKLLENNFIKVRKSVLLKNPNLDDYSDAIVYIVRADGIIIGTLYPFPTKFKAGDEILKATSASDLFVLKEFEKYAAGADLVMAPIKEKGSNAVILGDISAEGMDCYHAFRFFDFALPKMIQPHSSRFIFQNFGLKGFTLNLAYRTVNLFLRSFISCSMWKLRRLANKYEIKQLTTVPEWIDDMVLNDGHKYMEVHNHKWMQWCIDNSFSSDKSRSMAFYGIYDKNQQPLGFFVNKIHTSSVPSRNIYGMRTGTIMEWGSYNEERLSELDITKIAASYFPKDVDAIQYASLDESVLKKMKRYGFLHHNYHHVVVKDTTKRFKEAKDPNLWRLRFGYGDSMFS